MIALLLAQAAVPISDTDRASFADFRKCVLAYVDDVAAPTFVDAALAAARKSCEMDETAAGLEMAEVDMEQKADGHRAKNDADHRIAALNRELTVEATAAFEHKKTDVKP